MMSTSVCVQKSKASQDRRRAKLVSADSLSAQWSKSERLLRAKIAQTKIRQLYQSLFGDEQKSQFDLVMENRSS